MALLCLFRVKVMMIRAKAEGTLSGCIQRRWLGAKKKVMIPITDEKDVGAHCRVLNAYMQCCISI